MSVTVRVGVSVTVRVGVSVTFRVGVRGLGVRVRVEVRARLCRLDQLAPTQAQRHIGGREELRGARRGREEVRGESRREVARSSGR